MTDLIYDFISSGVDMLMTAVVLSGVITLLQTANILTNVTAMQQANADMVDYYREFNHLDSKEAQTSDIQSFILRYYPEIQAKIVFKEPQVSGAAPSNPNYLIVDGTHIYWMGYTKNADNSWSYKQTEIPIEHLLNGQTKAIPWDYGKKWHVILREDMEDINSLWGANYNEFKMNYYDGGAVTGIYAIYSPN